MAANNSLTLFGNLTRDPETRHVGGDKTVTKFGMAVNGYQKDKPLFIDVEIWGRKAELVAESFAKGSRIQVEGELALDTYEAKDGSGKRQKHYMKANDFSFIDKKGEVAGGEREEAPTGPPASTRKPGRPAPQPAADDDEDDIPF